MDDVHSAENYVSALWSVRIDRLNPEHAGIHTAVANLLKPILEPFNYARLIGEIDATTNDKSWIVSSRRSKTSLGK